MPGFASTIAFQEDKLNLVAIPESVSPATTVYSCIVGTTGGVGATFVLFAAVASATCWMLVTSSAGGLVPPSCATCSSVGLWQPWIKSAINPRMLMESVQNT